jgi:hypothetical protein
MTERMTEALFVLSHQSVSVRLPGLRPEGSEREKEGDSRDSAQLLQVGEDRWSRSEFSSRDQPRPLPAQHKQIPRLRSHGLPGQAEFRLATQTPPKRLKFQRSKLQASGPWGQWL